MSRIRRIIAAVALFAAVVEVTIGQGVGAPLDDLTRVRPGRSKRVSSAAESALSNSDNRWIKPGNTYVLADVRGPGVIRHMWLTFSEPAPNWLSADGSADHSEIVLRCYWDDSEMPAVESPLGDFFAAGFGVRAEVNSVPVQVQGGDSYNCFWPMPFFKRARITITNESARRLSALYYHVDYTEEDLPPETAFFCAQYRQEFPQKTGGDYLIADIEGRGHYVGTVMSARSRSPEWFGEGDEKFYVDGEPRASIWGTGTEDYFLNAWGLEKNCLPLFGVPFLDGDWGDVGTRVCAYRWHIPDPVRFTKSLRFEIEHWGWMSADETESGKVEGHVERQDDMATVAFWYQVGQPKRFAKLPSAAERRFPNLDVIVEARQFLGKTKHAGGSTSLQRGYVWTGDGQLFYVPENETDSAPTSRPHLQFEFNVEKTERRRLMLRLTHSYDYGIWRIALDGKAIGEPIDLYSRQIEVHDHSLGDHELPLGVHTIRLECTGRNPQSAGSRLGVDSVRLRERWNIKRPSPKP
jgi:hypothetical protein